MEVHIISIIYARLLSLCDNSNGVADDGEFKWDMCLSDVSKIKGKRKNTLYF